MSRQYYVESDTHIESLSYKSNDYLILLFQLFIITANIDIATQDFVCIELYVLRVCDCIGVNTECAIVSQWPHVYRKQKQVDQYVLIVNY